MRACLSIVKMIIIIIAAAVAVGHNFVVAFS